MTPQAANLARAGYAAQIGNDRELVERMEGRIAAAIGRVWYG